MSEIIHALLHGFFTRPERFSAYGEQCKSHKDHFVRRKEVFARLYDLTNLQADSLSERPIQYLPVCVQLLSFAV